MEFKDYGFKPVDVINGLNTYYSAKDSEYLHITKEKHSYWHLLDKDVTDAINWLREEHNIFYTPGMKLEDPADCVKDIFDNPRYRFLSKLSAELGFRTIVGPGNADKTEEDILKLVKHRDEQSKAMDDNRREFLRNLRCELGVPIPVANGCIEEMEYDILERIGKLKEGNWPCENANSFATHMKKQFPKECEKWNVTPLQNGSVHDWVQYIFGVLDEWRKRALKDEEEWDAVYEVLGLNPEKDDVEDVVAAIMKLREDRAKYKGWLNTWYGASCGDNVLPCYRDTCNNPKAIRERDAANDVLSELRSKIREIYRSVVDDEWDEHLGYTSALNDINEEYKRVVHNFEEATDNWSNMSLQEFRDNVCEIFDIQSSTAYKRIIKELRDIAERYDRLARLRSDICSELSLAPESCDGNIFGRIHMMQDCHDKLCKDYTELRKAIWEAMDRKPETLPDKTARLVGEVRMLQLNYKNMHDLFVDYGAAQKILSDINEFRKWAIEELKQHGIVVSDLEYPEHIDVPCSDIFRKLLKRYDWAYGEYKEQYRLRQQWHAKWGSENERANGEHKRAEKLEKDYAELGEAYSSVLRWNNSYAEVRRLLGVSADADAETMISAVKLLRDKDPMDIQKQNDDLIAGYNKLMSYKIQIEKELHKKDLKLSDSERRRKMWMARYESEHKRANGEHKRAEGCFNDIAALKTQVSHLMRERDAMANEEVGLQSLKNAVRKLQHEKNRVIEALGQDIWDDAVK